MLASACAWAVALRKESVDRNIFAGGWGNGNGVALRKESVDRNNKKKGMQDAQFVALRKESVDRNSDTDTPNWTDEQSLSARRAWIEMYLTILKIYATLSLSARRAWIEIVWWPCTLRRAVGRSPQGERG